MNEVPNNAEEKPKELADGVVEEALNKIGRRTFLKNLAFLGAGGLGLRLLENRSENKNESILNTEDNEPVLNIQDIDCAQLAYVLGYINNKDFTTEEIRNLTVGIGTLSQQEKVKLFAWIMDSLLTKINEIKGDLMSSLERPHIKRLSSVKQTQDLLSALEAYLLAFESVFNDLRGLRDELLGKMSLLKNLLGEIEKKEVKII